MVFGLVVDDVDYVIDGDVVNEDVVFVYYWCRDLVMVGELLCYFLVVFVDVDGWLFVVD